MIRCICGNKVFDGTILRIRVGQINQEEGLMNLKCACKRWLERIPIGYLTGEIQGDLDFRNINLNINLNNSKRQI